MASMFQNAISRNTKCAEVTVFAEEVTYVEYILRCTTGFLEPVNGFNKDVSGTGLLPMTVSTYPMD